MTELVQHPVVGASMNLRPSVGLLLSIGEPPNDQRNYPTKLDHFRAKPGQLDQYRVAAEKFHEVYGMEPQAIDEVYFLSNAIGDILDVRRKVWGTSGLKAVSQTNFATYPPEVFRERVDAWDDELLVFPDDSPDATTYQLKGTDDPAIARGKMKVYATLRVCLPKVTGMGQVVEITTTGRRSTDNLFASLVYAQGILRGNLIGIPFRLSVRPARMRYFDQKEKKRKSTEFFELVLDTPLTMMELFDAVTKQAALGQPARLELPPVNHGDVDRDEELIPEFFADSQERQIDTVLGTTRPPQTEPPDDTPAEQADEADWTEAVPVDEAGQASFADMVPESARGKT
jgi:hypothetical protein